MKYRIGTRKSLLAKVQSNFILNALKAEGLQSELVEIVSEGDANHTKPLYEIETSSPGLFTKQLEVALEENRIDLAVHSLKDLPTLQPENLQVSAITERVQGGDSLVILKKNLRKDLLFGIPPNARVGTSSLRREAQLYSQRKDIKVVPIRGNVPTRADYVSTGKLEAVVLAEAGLKRLNLSFDSEVVILPLPHKVFIPAPGQGALAIETRKQISDDLKKALASLHHSKTAKEVNIERTILRELEGGCTLPLGVRCVEESNSLKINAFLGIAHSDGKGGREWSSFPTFDISEPDEKTAIQKTVAYFREKMKHG